ncbi:hypothetical protein T439DRAFT_380073 [Meredithblackwellia eburnea MCA 4105]
MKRAHSLLGQSLRQRGAHELGQVASFSTSSPRFGAKTIRTFAPRSRWGTGVTFGLLGLTGLVAAAQAANTLRLDSQQVPAVIESNESEIDPTNLPKTVKWVVLHGTVYDLTEFLDAHPGGAEEILPFLFTDITAVFTLRHSPTTLSRILPTGLLKSLGKLSPSAKVAIASTGEAEAEARRAKAPPLESIESLDEFAAIAKEVLGETSHAWNYYAGFADSGASLENNRTSYSFVRFLPKVLIACPTPAPLTSTTLLSSPSPLPVFFCPTAQMRAGHPDGEYNHAIASTITRIPHTLSNAASLSINEYAAKRKELGSKSVFWWQLYLRKERSESEAQLKEAMAGGATAVLWTVDTPWLGRRGRGSAAFTDGMASGGRTVQFQSSMEDNLVWSDIAWIKSIAKSLPVIVKGVGRPEDVKLAQEHGAQGVVLSNHGGRQLDHGSPPLAVLVRTRKMYPELFAEGSKFEVYLDGGVTRGADIVKAVCLGAKAVGIGRPIIYAQTVYGAQGIEHAVRLLGEEITMTMKLLGANTVDDLKPEMVEVLDGLLGERGK